jgi:8-amino-7-oxononanoate synthase
LDGTTPHHTNLENRLAEFFRYSDSQEHTSALLFNSGYDANVSFFSTIPQRGDYIVYDELVHASVWDGMRANSRRGVPEASRFSFAHNSVQALEKRLNNIVQQESKKSGSGVIYIAIESLYSMDGDLCPLSELVEVLQRLSRRHPLIINPKRVCLILDEAHTTGVLGADGRGLAWDLDHRGTRTGNGILRDWVQVRIMTFGKAVGSQGGR